MNYESERIDNKEKKVDIIIEHYRSARNDIIEKLRLRDRVIQLWLTGVAIIFAFASTNSEEKWILLFIPFLSVVISAIYAGTDLNIGMISRWLSLEYTSQLENITGQKISHWDNSTLNKKEQILSFGLRYIFIGFVFLICCIAAYIFRINAIKEDYKMSYMFYVETFYFLFCALMIAFIFTICGRQRRDMHVNQLIDS